MRAIVNYENLPFHVEMREQPVPEIGRDDALIAVRNVGVCGSDLHQWHASQSWPVQHPVTLGHEFAGIVAKLGADVTGFRVGDRVVSETAAHICGRCAYCRTGAYNLCPERLGFGYGMDGAMADYVRVPARCLHSLPDNVPFEDGAMTEPACVACHAALELSHITPGDTVVILGPGTIGLMVAQMCRLAGAGDIVLVGAGCDAARLAIGQILGATQTLDGGGAEVTDYVRGSGDGLGAELVFDCVGRSSALKTCLDLVRPAGQITKVGWGREPLEFSLDPLVQKAVTLQGAFSHTYATWERVIRLMSTGSLVLAPMRKVFSLDDWSPAFKQMDSMALPKSVLAP